MRIAQLHDYANQRRSGAPFALTGFVSLSTTLLALRFVDNLEATSLLPSNLTRLMHP
jgi:hypothetical protein